LNKIIIFPFLISIFPILLLYSENIDETWVSINDIVIPIIITLVVTLSLFIFLRFLLKNSIKAGFIVTVVSTIVFSYAYVFNGLESLSFLDSILLRARYVVIPLLIILATSKGKGEPPEGQ